MLTLPSNFILARLRFTLEALDPLFLPPVKSGALRGGFGHVLKRLACKRPGACDQGCRLGNACAYGYIFETAPPVTAGALSNFSDIPRPFVIQTPPDRRTHIPPGDTLVFGLTLIGQAIGFLPDFVAVFIHMGQTGLGAEDRRGQYRLATVEAVSPYGNETELLYRAGEAEVRVPKILVTPDMVLDYASRLAADEITLDFVTPTELKHEGRPVVGPPPFEALVSRLRDRVSSLSLFHCGQPLEADFQGLAERAKRVRIADSATGREEWQRYSNRQQKRVYMGGLTGRVTYAGDLAEYLPLLALGELIHVGKGNVFGNGQYRIAPPEPERPSRQPAAGAARAGTTAGEDNVTVLNFAHPLTAEHLAQVEALAGRAVGAVIDIDSQVDPTAGLAGQVSALVEQVGFSSREWQSRPLLVNLPSLNHLAGLLVAELHGRCGYFPACLRLRAIAGEALPQYEVAEILNLQEVRDRARASR